MTTNPAAAQPLTRLGEALELMALHGLRHLPVAEGDGRFVGLICEYDVHAAISEEGDVILDRGVRSITRMHTPTLQGDDSVEDAWALLSRSPGLNPLPIVADGMLVGTVSQRDLLRAMGGLPKVTKPPNGKRPQAGGGWAWSSATTDHHHTRGRAREGDGAAAGGEGRSPLV